MSIGSSDVASLTLSQIKCVGCQRQVFNCQHTLQQLSLGRINFTTSTSVWHSTGISHWQVVLNNNINNNNINNNNNNNNNNKFPSLEIKIIISTQNTILVHLTSVKLAA